MTNQQILTKAIKKAVDEGDSRPRLRTHWEPIRYTPLWPWLAMNYTLIILIFVLIGLLIKAFCDA